MPYDNHLLAQVIQRYEVPSMEAHTKGPDKDFISSVLHCFEGGTFCPSQFDRFSIDIVMDYIRFTHAYYLQKKLPEIEQSILLLHRHYESNHPLLALLHNFFQSYCQDLRTHLNDEESRLLPYISLLSQAEISPKHLSLYIVSKDTYSLSKFLAEHHDTEDELARIRETIRIYSPPATNKSLYRILLAQLENFEQDMHVHGLLEDHVLLPKALTVECDLENKLRDISVWN